MEDAGSTGGSSGPAAQAGAREAAAAEDSREPVTGPLLRMVDSLQIPVPSVDAALGFYRDALGHELIWRTERAAGLRMPDSETEIVVQTERPEPEVDVLVESVDAAVRRVVEAGGAVRAGPFEIPVGRVVLAADPFGNPLVLLDLSKGRYRTDASGTVTGVEG
jgi:predicted enzyme related to lactoylglutathione lyase